MKLLITNPSSPGSSLTLNTIKTLTYIYKYCENNPSKTFGLESIVTAAGFNWKNIRTICPLMRYFEFIDYDQYTNLTTDSFFTSRGSTYMNAIILEQEGKCTTAIVNNLQKIQCSLIKGGLNSLLMNKSCNYQWIIRRTIEYLQMYSKINKKEFAYLIYAEQNKKALYSQEFSSTIQSYRNKVLDFDVKVIIRDDQQGNSKETEKDIKYLTAYGYITNILFQAEIVSKESDYFSLNNNIDEVKEILSGVYDEQSR